MARKNNSRGGRNPNQPRGAYLQPPKSVTTIAKNLGFKPSFDGTFIPKSEGVPAARQKAHVIAKPIGRAVAYRALDALDGIVANSSTVSRASKRTQPSLLFVPRQMVAEGLVRQFGDGLLPKSALQRWLDECEDDISPTSFDSLDVPISSVGLRRRPTKSGPPDSYFLNVYVSDGLDSEEPQLKSEKEALNKALEIPSDSSMHHETKGITYPIGWGVITVEENCSTTELIASARAVLPSVVTLEPIAIIPVEHDIKIK